MSWCGCCSDDACIPMKRKKEQLSIFCGCVSDSDLDNEPSNEKNTDANFVDDHDDNLLYLGDELNELADESKALIASTDAQIQLDIPKIVVMGAQSSGKSSFLNCLIKYDLMPTGHNMITKNPVYIRMYKIKSDKQIDECAKISTYENDVFTTHKTVLLNSENYKTTFNAEFATIATKIVGKWDNISTKPIYIDIYSHKVSNLTLVDLPGIIAIPKTDKGQSLTLVDDIKQLVEMEVTKKNTYVVLCIEAKPDLETDIGLSTFRELKKKNESLKAVTLFTKIDMLEKDRLVQFQLMLKDGLSRDLQTDDGYFCTSAKYDTVPDWYHYHLGGASSPIYKSRSFGTKNFFVFLKRKIIGSMKRSFNKIRENMDEFIKKISELNPQFNNNLKNKGEKLTFIVHNIYILSRAIGNSFNAIGHDNNVAHDFKLTFNNYSKSIRKLDPFSSGNLPDDKLKKIMDNFEGYLPSTKITATSVINKCLKDEELKPMKQIIDTTAECMDAIGKIIYKLINIFLEMDKLDIHQQELNSFSVPIYYFPNLKEFILKSAEELIKKYTAEALKVVSDYLRVQEKQVWVGRKDLERMYDTNLTLETKLNESDNANLTSIVTAEDDDKFNYDTYMHDDEGSKKRDDHVSDFEINPNSSRSLYEMRYLSRTVYGRIANSTQTVALKTIITTIIKKIENHFFLEIIKKINNVNDINQYFYDSDEKVQQNYKIELLLEKANKLNASIKNFDFY